MKNSIRKKMILIIVISLLVRFLLFNYESADYRVWISDWINFIKDNGGFNSLKYSFTNYNLPYVTILVILTYIPIKTLYLVKLVSVIFDVLLAILGYKFVMDFYKEDNVNKKQSLAFNCFTIILFLPTVIMNSAQWAQCDSIYAFFSLLSIYLLLKNKVSLSFVAYGIAFAFKLQAIFLLPVFGILLFCKKNIKIYHFLIIPIVNFILCLPGIIFGASPLYTYNTYFLQSGTYSNSINVMNYYNYYTIKFSLNHPNIVNTIGFIIVFIVFLGLFIYCMINRKKFNTKSITLLFLLSICICYFFLPCMHDRYLYCADVLSVIVYYLFIRKKYVPIVINTCSTLSYFFLMAYLPLRWVFRKIMPIFLIIDMYIIFSELNKEVKNS